MDTQLMKNYGICLIQMCVTEDKTANKTTAERLIRTACQKYTPRCVMLPEYCMVPFGKRQLFERCAETIPTGETCTLFAKLAAELKVHIVCGSIPECDERDDKKLYNTMVVFGTNGELVAKHRQLHLLKTTTKTTVGDDVLKMITTIKDTTKVITKMDCDQMVRRDGADFINCGQTIGMFEMDGIKVGMCVGTDLLYGCVATICREKGCDVLLCATSWPYCLGKLCVEKLLCVRAIETGCIVVGVSMACMKNTDYVTCGKTMCVDPCGRVLCVAGEGEEILCQRCDLVGLKDIRTLLPVFESRRTDVTVSRR